MKSKQPDKGKSNENAHSLEMKVCIISLCEESHSAEMMAKEKRACMVKEGVINVNHGIVINCNIRKSWRQGDNLTHM